MSKKFFIKIVTDPDVDLRKCIVGIACAAQAITDGYDVDVFFAADGVKMIHAAYIQSVQQVPRRRTASPKRTLMKCSSRVTRIG